MDPDRLKPDPELSPSAEIAALRSGGGEALSAFYRSHAATVLAWAIRLGGVDLDPEDLTRRTFARSLRHLDKLRGHGGVNGWLLTHLLREVRRARWRARLRRWLPWRTGRRAASPSTGPGALHLRRRQRVQRALARLPLDLRTVVVLVELEGRSAAQAGALLGITPHAVLGRLAQARPLVEAAARAEGLSPGMASGGGTVLSLPRRGAPSDRQ